MQYFTPALKGLVSSPSRGVPSSNAVGAFIIVLFASTPSFRPSWLPTLSLLGIRDVEPNAVFPLFPLLKVKLCL